MAATFSTENLEPLSLWRVGLRVTAPGPAMLAALREDDHLAVEEIAIAARRRLGSVFTQAVYDVLHALADAVCRSCGAVTDVAVGHAPCLEPDQPAGPRRREGRIHPLGLCAACRADRDQPQPRKESPR